MGRKEKGRNRRREEGKETDRQEEGGGQEEKEGRKEVESPKCYFHGINKQGFAWNSRSLYFVLL